MVRGLQVTRQQVGKELLRAVDMPRKLCWTRGRGSFVVHSIRSISKRYCKIFVEIQHFSLDVIPKLSTNNWHYMKWSWAVRSSCVKLTGRVPTKAKAVTKKHLSILGLGNFFSARGHLHVYNLICPYRVVRKPAVVLLNVESFLWLPCQGTTHWLPRLHITHPWLELFKHATWWSWGKKKGTKLSTILRYLKENVRKKSL